MIKTRKFSAWLRRARKSGLVLLVVIGAQPIDARAQSITCAQAVTLLSTGGSPTRTQLAGASSRILECGDTAPGAIVAALRLAAPNTVRDTMAMGDAWALLDRRLSDSVIALAKDPHQTVTRRVFYLSLLARYVAPTVGVDPTGARKMNATVLVTVLHPGVVAGNLPMDVAARDRARAGIAWMATNDPSLDIRRLAGLVAAQLARYAP